ncbi:MAG: hypothetical protein LBT16_11795 [Treponema sp.]|jgi:hypothetical protein|nr:hypothetical protein [Treponema sp.]
MNNCGFKKYCIVIIFLLFLGICNSYAADYFNGRIKLSLNENTGRFSLYYLVDTVMNRYEPLFADQDLRTSSLTVMINDRTYKLGETTAFTVKAGGKRNNPSFIFESSLLTVTQEFSFISTGDDPQSNGVCMNIKLESRGGRINTVGIKFLIDTKLGEIANINSDHFATDKRGIRSETLLDYHEEDKWWISRNAQYGLMGSIITDYSTRPDSVHFANWKRLNDMPWELQFSRRNFNNPPYSINDSAVSYIFNPVRLSPGETKNFTILLAAEDRTGFARVASDSTRQNSQNAGSNPSPQSPERTASLSINYQPKENQETIRGDLEILNDLLARLNEYSSGAIAISDDEVLAMELVIDRIKNRYGFR